MARDEPSERESPLLLFDGVCNLCSASVGFILRHDRRKRFRFASLQSAAGRAILMRHGVPPDELGSVVLLEDDRLYTRSTAALRTARLLDAPWCLLYALIAVPRFVRDPVYRVIAKNRYRWFGKRESCLMPAAELTGRFLE